MSDKMDSEIIITYETPVAEIERVAHLIGNGLAPQFSSGDYAHACSDLIHLAIITNLSEIATKLSLPLSQMKDDRKHIYWWMQGMPTMRALLHAIPHWAELDAAMALSAPVLKTKDIETIPEQISIGCYLFCMFAVWYGAKPDCKRKILNNRATKTLNNAMKTMGIKGVLTQMWMAATQYVVLGEKVFEPAWQRIISGRDERAINRMSDKSAKPVRRGRKVECSSFADLAQIVSK